MHTQTVRGEMEIETFVVEMTVKTKHSVTGGGKRTKEVVTGEVCIVYIYLHALFHGSESVIHYNTELLDCH